MIYYLTPDIERYGKPNNAIQTFINNVNKSLELRLNAMPLKGKYILNKDLELHYGPMGVSLFCKEDIIKCEYQNHNLVVNDGYVLSSELLCTWLIYIDMVMNKTFKNSLFMRGADISLVNNTKGDIYTNESSLLDVQNKYVRRLTYEGFLI